MHFFRPLFSTLTNVEKSVLNVVAQLIAYVYLGLNILFPVGGTELATNPKTQTNVSSYLYSYF